jgi:hypothetical protein
VKSEKRNMKAWRHGGMEAWNFGTKNPIKETQNTIKEGK